MTTPAMPPAYHRITERTFAYNVAVPEAAAQDIAQFLISAEGMSVENLANGSSFAITAREDDGVRRVWLSLASFDRLRDQPRFCEFARRALKNNLDRF